MQPTPLDRELFLHEVTTHRYQRCDFYAECVRIAGVHAWCSFTCIRCVFYVRPAERRKRNVPRNSRNNQNTRKGRL